MASNRVEPRVSRMDVSKLRAIVEAQAPTLIRGLGIAHWTIAFHYSLRGSKGDFARKAECTRQVDYNRASINFDADEFETEEEVVAVLLHELIHVVLTPFDILWNTACAFWPGDTPQSRVMDSVWDHAVEQAVINVQRVCENFPAVKRHEREHTAAEPLDSGGAGQVPDGPEPVQ